MQPSLMKLWGAKNPVSRKRSSSVDEAQETKRIKLAGKLSGLKNSLKKFAREEKEQSAVDSSQEGASTSSLAPSHNSDPSSDDPSSPEVMIVDEGSSSYFQAGTSSLSQPSSTNQPGSSSKLPSTPVPKSPNATPHNDTTLSNYKAPASVKTQLTSKAEAKSKKSKSDVASASPTLSKQYTPLEQQFIAIKAQHPDAVLFVECGYKYRFFGEDAEIASKLLNIGCFPDHNFFTASIPVHRLHIHLRRLVAAGHKVGVVKQTETAALKAASEKKSGPFTRELTALYTRTTLIGPDVHRGGEEGAFGSETQEEEQGLFLMCLCEGRPLKTRGKQKETTIGFLAVQPSAGNMVYDEFTDNPLSFSELETRLAHLQPAEIIYPHGTSKTLEKTLLEWKRHCGATGLRLEKFPEDWCEYNKAFSVMTDFYGPPTQTGEDCDTTRVAESLQIVTNLPSSVICCVGALVRHLEVFKLQRVLALTCNMKPFSIGSHCLRLPRRTIQNLEIFHNQTSGTEKGTLFKTLDHTHSPFGRRLLKKWISYPLRDLKRIQQRQEAIKELNTSESPCILMLNQVLNKLPDLEKMLCSAYHKKCSPSQFYSLTKALSRVCAELFSCSAMAVADLHSDLLQQTFKDVPSLLKNITEFLESLNEQAARDGTYEDLFAKPEQFPGVLKEKRAIVDMKKRLRDHRKEFRRTLGGSYNSLDYITVSGAQYLVEVKNKDVDRVPSRLDKSYTKQVTRFHPPYVLESVRTLAQHCEQLVINAKTAWNDFLIDFSVHYGSFKKAVDILAMTDCLLSLSRVAKMPGYVCPTVVEEPIISIEDGRHPVIDMLLGEGEQYVPNSTHISSSGLRAMIITGPNMGGKSSYIKQVALLCIMAQVGSFIPASSASIGLLDAVFTRMGASDNICKGMSTFMVELSEASEIMKLASPNSLVILDELGRGTSTHDGTAVAYATLNYFVKKVGCMTLFVTHYPLLAELEQQFPAAVGNFHMAYVETEELSEDYDKIVFLYQLERGKAGGSYGLNVAALAGLDTAILKVAGGKSKELQMATLKSTKSQDTTFLRVWWLLEESGEITSEVLCQTIGM